MKQPVLKTSILGGILLSMPFFYVPSVSAEVVDSAEDGFTIQFERRIYAPPETVYQALTQQVGQWWINEHTWYGDRGNMQLDARAGGCFCEIAGERQTEHMRVVKVEPNQLIRLVGGLGPLQAQGLYGALDWRMQPMSENAPNETRFTLYYRVGGYTPDDLTKWAPVVDQVLQQQMDSMKGFVETDK